MSALAKLATKYEALSGRERGIIFAAMLVGLLLLLSMPLERLWLGYRNTGQQLTEVQNASRLTQQQIDLYQERLAKDPNRDYLQRKKLLQAEHQRLDQALDNQLVDMVPARQMPAVLAQMLAGAKGLQLTGFESMDPVPLIEVGEAKKLDLYSHGIVLTLEGDFFAMLRFIQAVESMQDKLYWKRLDYRVKDYPKAEVTLELLSLSINEDFIRVDNS